MLPYGRKDPLPFPFSGRSPVSGLCQTKTQRETGVKRVETAGVYPLAHCRGTANSPLNLSEKLSALIERIACAVQVHQQTTAEKAAAQTGRIADATHIPRKISAEKRKSSNFCCCLDVGVELSSRAVASQVLSP